MGLKCRCLHLTDFAAEEREVKFPLPTIKLDFGNFADIKIGAIIYIAVLTGIFAGLAALCFVVDQMRQRSILTEYYNVIHAAVMDRRRSQGATINQSSFPLDSMGCERLVAAQPKQTGQEQNNLSRYSLLSMGIRVIQNHPWLEIFTASPNSVYTMPQRLCSVACIIMSAMMFNGMFFVPKTALQNQQTVNFFYPMSCVGVSAQMIARGNCFIFNRTRRTKWDVKNWYVPEWARETLRHVGMSPSTEMYIKNRQGDLGTGGIIELNRFEMGEVEFALLSDGKVLCALSVNIVVPSVAVNYPYAQEIAYEFEEGIPVDVLDDKVHGGAFGYNAWIRTHDWAKERHDAQTYEERAKSETPIDFHDKVNFAVSYDKALPGRGLDDKIQHEMGGERLTLQDPNEKPWLRWALPRIDAFVSC